MFRNQRDVRIAIKKIGGFDRQSYSQKWWEETLALSESNSHEEREKIIYLFNLRKKMEEQFGLTVNRCLCCKKKRQKLFRPPKKCCKPKFNLTCTPLAARGWYDREEDSFLDEGLKRVYLDGS